MHICIVLDLIYADVLYDCVCVCVCVFDSERLRATASMFIAGKLPQALSLFTCYFQTHTVMMLSFFNEMSLKIFHPVDMPAVDYLTIILKDLCNMQHVEKTF